DNMKVSLTRGRIIEENHYYAYGLKIAGISSKKLGDVNEGGLGNKNLYNDKELFDDADLNWYDYGFRNYDPQIGRFTQLDPLTWDYPELTN
ncbi:RHS repeat-associated core domain-containing protein, partial [Acinetobacter baumannii]